jgi:hypothetical protein
VALCFGLRHLFAALAKSGSRGVSLLWSILFWFVAAQLAAYLGPMLVHTPGEPLFPFEKGSFMSRAGDADRYDIRHRAEQRETAATKATAETKQPTTQPATGSDAAAPEALPARHRP